MNFQMSKNSFWVFDLDDTLYKEVDFRNSGFEFVRQEIIRLYKRDIIELLKKYNRGASQDIFSDICQFLKLPESSKNQFIWMYRNHYPAITIENDVLTILNNLKENTLGVAILTDGRTITQRNKIKALNLQEFDVFISEEFNDLEKPNPQRFKFIQSFYHDCTYVYVGDNLKKDFITPNELGWKTIGIIDDGRNIHKQDGYFSEEYHPHIWLRSILDLKGIISC
jgi:putative hydrolase of the HAD superfamily